MPESGLAAEVYKISFLFNGSHTPIELKAGGTPLKIGYANNGDDIFDTIRTKKATIQLIATDGIDLDAFYLQSDRECKVIIEKWTGSGYGEKIFKGWLTAFDAREPFLCRPYTFELTAHCGLSSLKDFNFSATGLVSFNSAIKQCLAATGLGLIYTVGVDTRISGDTGDPTQLYGFEAEAMNGKTCADVLTHILDSFVADVEQSKGDWVIRGLSEQAEDGIAVYDYMSDGDPLGGYNVGYTVNSGRNSTRREVTAGEVQKEPAISYVQIDYDLGRLRDLLKNGSFTAQSFIGDYSYDNWDRYNGIQGVKQTPSGVKILGRTEYWFINEDGSRVPGVGGTGILLPKYLGLDPMFIDTKYYESQAITISSAQKTVIKGRFQPKYVDYARLEVFIYDSANPNTSKLWLTKDGEWKETRDFVLLDYSKQVVRVYGDDPAPLVWYPFEITSGDIPTKRTASTSTASGNKPYTVVRYNALKVRVFRGVFNNTVPVSTAAEDSFCIYDNLAVNFQSKNSDNLALKYGFKNALYVRKNPIKLSIPFGGYSVATTGGAGRIRDASLNNYASVIRRMDGGDIIDAWTKAGNGVLSDFIRLNGISRLRLGHKFGYSWEGDIVGEFADSLQHFNFEAQNGVKYKPTAYEYDFKTRTASVTLKQLLRGSFSYAETLDEGEASASGAVANTITNGSGNAKLTDPDAFTDRGLIDEPVDFDVVVLNGEYRIEVENWDDFEHAPIFGGSVGRLRVFESEGFILQYYYPEFGGIMWREYSIDEATGDPLWLPEGGWHIGAEGTMRAESAEDDPEPKYVTVVDFYNRGHASGMSLRVPTEFAFEKQNLDAFIDRTGPTDPTEVTSATTNFNTFVSDGGDYLISLDDWDDAVNAPTALAVGGRLTTVKDDGKVIQKYQQGGAVLTRTRQKKNPDNSYTWTAWVVDAEAVIETFINDFNEMVEMGAYHIATADIPSNAPDGAATGGMLHVFITDGELMQRYYIDGEIYFRSRLGGTWGDWNEGAAGLMFDAETPSDTVEVTTEYVDGIALAETVPVYTKDYIDDLTTTDIPEPASDIINKYFTNARARAALSGGTGISYNPTTGEIAWTGTATSILAEAPIYYNSTTGALYWGGTTADVPEDSSYLYYTNARARAALSAGTGISYNSTTGVISSTITQYTNALARAAIDVAGGVLSYNSTTGVITLASNAYDGRYSQLGHTHAWSDITTGKPTTISGYGITNAYTKTEVDALLASFSGVPSGGTVAQYLRGDRVWAQLNTTAVSEGVSLYFTTSRARESLSAGTGISYNSSTGVIASTISQYTDALARAAISAGTGLSYNSTTGVMSSTITQYTDAMAKAAISVAGGVLSYSFVSGVITLSASAYDGRYSQLGHTHAWSEITGKPTTFAPSYHTHPYTEVTGITAGTGITYIGGVIASTITQYTNSDARAAFSAGTGISISSGVISWTGSAGVGGSGTTNRVPKFTGSTSLGDSLLYDTGSGIAINATNNAGYMFRLNGAMYADGDVSGVGMYIASGRAIRGLGDMYIDAAAGNMYFRTTAGYAYSMTLAGSIVLMGTVTINGSKTLQVTGGIRATGQQQFSNYTSASSYSGTAAGLLGFDSSGNILTVATGSFANFVHDHDSSYYTKGQLNTSGAGGIVHWDNIVGEPSTYPPTYHTHSMSEVIGLYAEFDNHYTKAQLNNSGGSAIHWNNITNVPSFLTSLPDHNHDSRYYTETELNTSGAGGAVHWDNVTNKPGSYNPSYHRTNWTDIDGAPSFLTSLPDHNHDDLYYREYEVNSLLSGKANNSHTHWYTDIGGAPWLTSESDPYGVSGIGLSMDNPSTLRVIVYLRNGGNYQATCIIFTGG